MPTRQQVRHRYQASIEEGSTTMDFESWLLDEVNALEFSLAELLAALKAIRDNGTASVAIPFKMRLAADAAIAKATSP